jgi:DNA-directed RNA polymerase subunit E'/Rpb7
LIKKILILLFRSKEVEVSRNAVALRPSRKEILQGQVVELESE